MRLSTLLLSISTLAMLSACSDETTPETPATEEATTQEDLNLSRGDVKRLRSLVQQLERVFSRLLKEKKDDAFTERQEEAAEGPPPFSVTIKDLQLLTPYMKSLKIDQTFSNTQEQTQQNNRKSWGAGLTVEVKNDTDKVLMQPDFGFGVKIATGYGDRSCTSNAEGQYSWRHIGSTQTNTKKPWAAETQGTEVYWRPGETIRRQVSATCSNQVLYDTGITGATVVLDLSAKHLLTDDYTKMNDVVKVDFPTDALTLRKVKLNGTDGYAFGSGTLSLQKGKITRGLLNSAGLRPDDAKAFSSLPDSTPVINLDLDELSISMGESKLTHWSDNAGMSKGSREFTITVKQAIDSATIKSRLNAALTTAKTKASQARTASETAAAAVTSAGADPAAVKTAKANAAKAAKAAKAAAKGEAAAQKAYNTGLAKARSRLATALMCDRIRLVTPSREIAPANAKEAKGACAALNKGDSASAVLRFKMARYEVPVGLSYSLAKKPSVAWIASQATTVWDPR